MARVKKHARWSRRLERNILAVYTRASEYDRAEGLEWYAHAHDEALRIADTYHLSLEAACGVIAAISPGKQWGLNVIDAEALIRAFQSGARGYKLPALSPYGGANIRKAESILLGSDPLEVLPETGPKVRAFYLCILDPRECREVVIDRHAKGLAVNRSGVRGATDSEFAVVRAGSEYTQLAWHYRVIAERLGLIPHQLQAICWVTWRRLQGNLDQQDLPF
jgi:hypothetical protein